MTERESVCIKVGTLMEFVESKKKINGSDLSGIFWSFELSSHGIVSVLSLEFCWNLCEFGYDVK